MRHFQHIAIGHGDGKPARIPVQCRHIIFVDKVRAMNAHKVRMIDQGIYIDF